MKESRKFEMNFKGVKEIVNVDWVNHMSGDEATLLDDSNLHVDFTTLDELEDILEDKGLEFCVEKGYLREL